ncbi:hypothetical protein H671_2g6433 [Cricetulus griseus]|nr:hypothetical protein H671_2g6433 [Cricetulus griseus]
MVFYDICVPHFIIHISAGRHLGCFLAIVKRAATSMNEHVSLAGYSLVDISPRESVYMVDHIDGFSYVEPSLHPWDEAYMTGMDDFSDVFLDSICQYFIENF